jgi:hypothetical protein
VHETGARMTHDIKNLLQSLVGADLGGGARQGTDREQLQALLRRQLPLIERRLLRDADKLQRPQEAARSTSPRACGGSRSRASTAARASSSTRATPPPGVRLPRSLFDSVADNLIRNALAKRADDEGLRVRVALECGRAPRAARLRQRLGGAGRIAASVLRAPVSSRSGLGIGLYQAARQAEASGYRLDAGIEPRRRRSAFADWSGGLGQHAGRDHAGRRTARPGSTAAGRRTRRRWRPAGAGRARRRSDCC